MSKKRNIENDNGLNEIYHDKGYHKFHEKNGLVEGIYEMFDLEGNLKGISHFKNGLHHGEFKSFHKNGVLSELGNYFNDLIEGEFKSFYESGKLETKRNYVNGKMTGEYFSYYENGNLEVFCNVIEGIQHGEFSSYHENGKLKQKGNYVGNKLDGKIILFNNQEVKIKTLNYKDGGENGLRSIWWENGNKKSEVMIIDGLKNHKKKCWNLSGGLRKELVYFEDKFVRAYHYDIEGKEIKGISKFDGDLIFENIKIRKKKYGDPWVYWLKPFPASLVLNIFSLFQNKFYLDESDEKELKEKIELFKNLFPEEYLNIFGKTLISNEAIKDFEQIEEAKENNLLSETFNNKFLKIYKGQNKDYEKWIVIDNSVVPSGIVFQSNSKEKSVKWINQW